MQVILFPEFDDRLGWRGEIKDIVIPFPLSVDFVSELAPALFMNLMDFSPFLGDPIGDFFKGFLAGFVTESCAQNVHPFIEPFSLLFFHLSFSNARSRWIYDTARNSNGISVFQTDICEIHRTGYTFIQPDFDGLDCPFQNAWNEFFFFLRESAQNMIR